MEPFSAKPQLRVLLDHLGRVEDTRQPWRVAYPLREVLFLVVAVPWVRDMLESGHRVRGFLAALLLAAHLIPQAKMEASTGISAHHSLSVALFALLVLTGPLKPTAETHARQATIE